MRTILLGLTAAAGLAAYAQAPGPDPFAAYVQGEGCQPEMFRTTLMRLSVFPELKRDTALAVCFFETAAKMPNGTAFMAKQQELRVIDPASMTELARHDIGCCSRKIVISVKTYTDEASNPVKNNPRPMSAALRALGVTHSANIYVDEDNGGTAHEFRIADGAWQRLFYH